MKAQSMHWRWLRAALFALLSSLTTAIAYAHEVRPAYLQIDEIGSGRYQLLWRTPVIAGMRLPVMLRLPDEIHEVKGPVVQELSDSLVERRLVDAGIQGLAGKRIEFVGLQATITDVLVRMQTLDGTHTTTLVHPSQPWLDIAPSAGPLAVATAFLSHGIEHILFGFDHLLFVLALILIVPSGRVLVWTITAFTLAHSITLSLATLGIVHVPGPPVEATIALSIILLACEIVRLRNGEPGLTARWPWAVAFIFGLLHGFGFAGALAELGLPQGDIPLALLSFNGGVEIGQLLFIGAVLGLLACIRHVRIPPLAKRHAPVAVAYLIGTTAAFWFIERLAAFLA